MHFSSWNIKVKIKINLKNKFNLKGLDFDKHNNIITKTPTRNSKNSKNFKNFKYFLPCFHYFSDKVQSGEALICANGKCPCKFRGFCDKYCNCDPDQCSQMYLFMNKNI